MNKNTAITILTIICAVVAINLIVAYHPFRIDITDNNIYTLAPSTEKILKELDDVVTIRAYFTEKLPPQMASVRRDVDDLLAEFKGFAGDKLQVEFIDPASSAMDEQKAQMMGIPPLQLNVLERDKREVAKVYLGMAILFGDKQQVLPVVQNVDSLEYDLAQAIIKVSAKDEISIAWWQGDRSEATEKSGNGFSGIKEYLSRRYKIVDIDDKTIADLDPSKQRSLILLSPRKMTETELFAVDQYLMGGGRVLAMVDRFDIGNGLQMIDVDTPAADLMVHYGATVEKSIVLDESNAMASFSGGFLTYQLPYPYWVNVRKEGFNTNEAIVSALSTLVMPWTSPLTLAKKDGDTADPMLAKSTEDAAYVPIAEAKLDPESTNETLMRAERKEIPLLAILKGPFSSYYSDGKFIPKGEGLKKESSDGAKIFIAGSSRWLQDRFLQMFPANAELFENAVDSFSMGDQLIGIRSRDAASRPIAILSDPARVVIKYANIAFGPIAVIAIGIVVFISRKKRNRAIQLSFGK